MKIALNMMSDSELVSCIRSFEDCLDLSSSGTMDQLCGGGDEGCFNKLLGMVEDLNKHSCFDQDDSCDDDEVKDACGECQDKCSSNFSCCPDEVCHTNSKGESYCVDNDEEDPNTCAPPSIDMDDQAIQTAFLESNIFCAKNADGDYCMATVSDEQIMDNLKGCDDVSDSMGCCWATIIGFGEVLGEIKADEVPSCGMDPDVYCSGVDMSMFKKAYEETSQAMKLARGEGGEEEKSSGMRTGAYIVSMIAGLIYFF